jgi:subtilase family serine protease
MNVKHNLAILITSALIAGCSGGGGGSPTLPSSSNGPNVMQPYTGPSQLANFQWGQQFVSRAQYVGPANFNTASVNVVVALQDMQGLLQYAQDVSNPASGLYRHFLTPQEIGNRFGATTANYQKVARYFASYGLHVGGWPQREMLFVVGPQPQLEAAFGTKFGMYSYGGKTFAAPTSMPHFATALPITAVSKLVQVRAMHSYLMRGPSGAQFRGYSTQQLAKIFDYQGAYDAGFTGTGINVAIIGTGPISPLDAQYLGNIYHAAIGTIKQMPVTDQGVSQALAGQPLPTPIPGGSPVPPYPYSSGLQSPPPVTAPCNGPLPTCNPEDGEAQLDSESVASLAPGATTLFYLAYNPNDCVYSPHGPTFGKPCPPGQGMPEEGVGLTDPETQQVIADNVADVITQSFGEGEPEAIETEAIYFNSEGQGFGPVEFASLAAEGIASFAASGDTGPFECTMFTGTEQKCASYPSGDPNVTSVGGVNATFNDNTGRSPLLTAWGSATAEGGNGSFGNNIGSGGGLSIVFPAPPWQQNLQISNGTATLSSSMRAQPDVALDADPNTGPSVVLNVPFGAEVAAIGGTSASSPEMAAMWALVLQACKETPSCATGSGPHPYRLGNPAPLLYAIYGKGFAPHGFTPQLPYANVFYDILFGDTSAFAPSTPSPGATPPPLLNGYQAGVGYDLVTGIGAPYAGHLIQAITGRSVP